MDDDGDCKVEGTAEGAGNKGTAAQEEEEGDLFLRLLVGKQQSGGEEEGGTDHSSEKATTVITTPTSINQCESSDESKMEACFKAFDKDEYVLSF